MGNYLPDEIVTDILVRLPPKFFGRCECLSKHWNTLISDPQFIKTNFSLNLRSRNKVLCMEDIEKSLAIVDVDAKPFVSFLTLKIREKQSWYRIFGSCNGLVLALDSEYKLFLLNPTTQAYKIACKQLFLRCIGAHVNVPYLGFVMIQLLMTTRLLPSLTRILFLFTLSKVAAGRGFWIAIMIPLINVTHRVWSRVSLNASIYWLHGGYMVLFITAFDFTTEKFREVPQPPGAINGPARALGTANLDVVGGCLCLCNRMHHWVLGEFDIWVMKECGVQESWTKYSVNVFDQLPRDQPQEGFVGDHLEELLLIHDKCYVKVWSYDANKGTWRKKVNGIYHIYECTFAESLISP